MAKRKEKDNMTTNDLQNTTQKTKCWATKIPLKCVWGYHVIKYLYIIKTWITYIPQHIDSIPWHNNIENKWPAARNNKKISFPIIFNSGTIFIILTNIVSILVQSGVNGISMTLNRYMHTEILVAAMLNKAYTITVSLMFKQFMN